MDSQTTMSDYPLKYSPRQGQFDLVRVKTGLFFLISFWKEEVNHDEEFD